MTHLLLPLLLLLGGQDAVPKDPPSPPALTSEEEVRRENVVLRNEVRLAYEKLAQCTADLGPLKAAGWKDETSKALADLVKSVEEKHPGYNWTIDGGFVKKDEPKK